MAFGSAFVWSLGRDPCNGATDFVVSETLDPQIGIDTLERFLTFDGCDAIS